MTSKQCIYKFLMVSVLALALLGSIEILLSQQSLLSLAAWQHIGLWTCLKAVGIAIIILILYFLISNSSLSKVLIFGSIQRLYENIKNSINGTKKPLGAAGLTLLCPIKNGSNAQESYAMQTRQYLQDMPRDEESPMAKVPNTYLCRFYVLNDVFYQGSPAEEEHLKSKYLVFSSNYYGDLETYLTDMWKYAEDDVKAIWQHCVTFDQVHSAADFITYIKKCQVKNHLFFNGSTGDPLEQQLKDLYLKQEFSRFAYTNQGVSAEALQDNFKTFLARTQPNNVHTPTWVAGAHKEMVKDS